MFQAPERDAETFNHFYALYGGVPTAYLNITAFLMGFSFVQYIKIRSNVNREVIYFCKQCYHKIHSPKRLCGQKQIVYINVSYVK